MSGLAGGCAKSDAPGTVAVASSGSSGVSFLSNSDAASVLVDPNQSLGDGGGFTPSPPMGTCSTDLVRVAVTPATVAATVTYPATAPVAQQQFTATGTYKDGSTHDVSGCVAWTSGASPLGTIGAAGAFAASAAGQFLITASSGAAVGTATVTVKLTGTINTTGVNTTTLDGTPGGTAPKVIYPLDGALFPFHFGDLAFQVTPPAGQNIARLAFEGEAIDVKVYAPCTPIATPAVPGACSISIPADLESHLAGASEAPSLKETVRMAGGSGGLVESAPLSARWSSMALPGTIYYWAKPGDSAAAVLGSGASAVVRMNLETSGSPPEVFYTNLDVTPYAQNLTGNYECVGCHAISLDGKKFGITLGGASVGSADGYGSLFALVDVATKAGLAARIDDVGGQFLPTGFATFTTFSPDDANVVQELQGQLYLRVADKTLASQGPLFPSMTEAQTHPFWSPKGGLLAFASWTPTLTIPHAYDSKDLNGNETPNAQIWTSAVTGTTFAAPTLLVPRVAGASEYYPTVSDDDALVVFNESSCQGPQTRGNYGGSPCDGYDDPSARLRLVAASGGTAFELDRASGRTAGWPTSETWGNSWPRFAPTHGTFQGKALYWVAFSSRRPYGGTLAGSAVGDTKPQLWFAAVAVDPKGTSGGDPSFAPVWLPMQNSPTPEKQWDGGVGASIGDGKTPTGNHVPQWVYKYVPYVPPPVPPPPPPPR